MSENSVTPPGFEKPNHPDFDRLMQVMREGLEAETQKPGFDIEEYVGRFIDAKSVSYLALARAVPVLELDSPDQVQENLGALMRVAMLYMEAVVIGMQFQQQEAG